MTDTVSLLVLVIVVRSADGDGGWSWLLPIGLLAGLFVLALVTVPRVARYVLEAELNTRAEKGLFLLAVLLLLSVLAEGIGTEDILGAFLAGICLNRALRAREVLKEHLQFVGHMLFVPLFLVETGMRLSLGALEEPGMWLLALGLVAVVLVSKGAAAAATTRLFSYSKTEGLAVASLSFPQAAATLAVVVIGMELDLFDPDTADAIIIVIFLTCLIGPLATRYAAKRISEAPPRG